MSVVLRHRVSRGVSLRSRSATRALSLEEPFDARPRATLDGPAPLAPCRWFGFELRTGARALACGLVAPFGRAEGPCHVRLGSEFEVSTVGAHRVGVTPPATFVSPLGDLETLAGLPVGGCVLEPGRRGVVASVRASRVLENACPGLVGRECSRSPDNACGVGATLARRDGQDASLDRDVLEQRRLDAPAGLGGCNPHLVGQRECDVVAELWPERPGRAGVQVRLVLDGDDPVDPAGVGLEPADLNPAVALATLQHPPVPSPVNRLADVPPGVARVGEGFPVPGPLGGRVPNSVQQVRVQAALAEGTAGSQPLGVADEDNGVPPAALGSQLARDDNWPTVAPLGGPVALCPPTDLQFEAELTVHTTRWAGRRHERVATGWPAQDTLPSRVASFLFGRRLRTGMTEQDAADGGTEGESGADGSAPGDDVDTTADGPAGAVDDADGSGAAAAAEESLEDIVGERGGDWEALGDIASDIEPDEELVEQVEARDTEDVAAELAGLREFAADREEQLDEREAEVEDLESRLARKQADFQNYKKRQEQKMEDIRARATEDLVTRLLDVRDNLARALEQDEDADIRSGVESTLQQFDEELDRENVVVIEPEPGEETDPTRHEVLMRVDSDQPEGTVNDVHRPGYEMGGKVLRPAQVTVSDGPSDS